MNVTYESLEQAVTDLLKEVENLDDPINKYEQNSSQIGEGGAAWSGTAADQAKPILNKLKADIISLQNTTRAFAKELGITKEEYETADANVVSNMYNKIDING